MEAAVSIMPGGFTTDSQPVPSIMPEGFTTSAVAYASCTVDERFALGSCSFCGKNQQEVHIIAGPAVMICEECVLLCVEILLERPGCKAVSDAIIHAAVSITPAFPGEGSAVGSVG